MTDEDTQTFDSNSAGDPIEDRLNADLGMNVAFVEQQLRFRIDHSRLVRGEEAELGYVFMDRELHPNAVIVFDTPAEAAAAVDTHPLVDSLAEEDCLQCYTRDTVTITHLTNREVILP